MREVAEEPLRNRLLIRCKCMQYGWQLDDQVAPIQEVHQTQIRFLLHLPASYQKSLCSGRYRCGQDTARLLPALVERSLLRS